MITNCLAFLLVGQNEERQGCSLPFGHSGKHSCDMTTVIDPGTGTPERMHVATVTWQAPISRVG